MGLTDHQWSDPGKNLIPIHTAGSKQLNGSSHFICIFKINIGDLRDSFCLDILKIHFFSGCHGS